MPMSKDELAKLPTVVSFDIEQEARDLMSPRSANMVLLGMAAPYIEILAIAQLRTAIETIFLTQGTGCCRRQPQSVRCGSGYQYAKKLKEKHDGQNSSF